MSFHDLLNGLLATLDIPYFEGQPEFAGDAPDAFISYNVYDVPALRGCGKEVLTAYYATVNIYTSGDDRARTAENIGTALNDLLTANGFSRISGSYGLSNDFPGYYHRIMDFSYCRSSD